MSRSRTFTLSDPVTVGGDTFTEVTMNSFKGSAVAAFVARRDEIAEAGNENAQYILCSISAQAPRELFEEMELADYAPILAFMQPHFAKLMDAVGNASPGKTTKSSGQAGA
ncbi:MAG: phage tail assembly protein [Pseudomonadota bacterium]